MKKSSNKFRGKNNKEHKKNSDFDYYSKNTNRSEKNERFLNNSAKNKNVENLKKIHDETGIDILDVLAEDTQWFMLDDKQLSPGVYRMKHDSMTTAYLDTYKDDKIRIIEEESTPVGEVLGLDIYSAVHLPTNKRMYITTGDITK